MVDAGAVRAHVTELRQQGVSIRRISEVSGVTAPTLYALLVGQPSKGLPPTRRVTHGVAQRLLAVTPPTAAPPVRDLDTLPDLARVDATGSRRRIHALAALGWSVQQLADRLGLARRQLQGRVLHGGEQVSVRTARAIRDLYDALCWQPPPADTAWQRAAVTRTKAWANRQGWVPPLAWDDDTIDDPAATPDLGREQRGVVDVDDVEHLRSFGYSDKAIADRFGVQLDSLYAALRRNERRGAA
ncbi:hypothetical protein [Pseudonocardia sp. NPDC049635]|uniref:hypothetical protein n=1 Tax=Pseudonocardia sp. NPDC049635 TaxID=3155506 RepID=UPI0033FBE755